MGVLGWTPSEFWEATADDLRYAVNGWIKAYGGKEEETEALTMDELEDLMDKFPDEK